MATAQSETVRPEPTVWSMPMCIPPLNASCHVMPEPPVNQGIRSQLPITLPLETFCVNGTPFYAIREIGQGTSGKVFEALAEGPDGKIGTYAVKHVRVQGHGKVFEENLKSCEEEIEFLKRFKDCNYVIQLVQSQMDERNGEVLLVMEIAELQFPYYCKC